MFPIGCSTLFEARGPDRTDTADPLVTVAVSLFNYGAYLDECLGSVAAQTHRRLDLIVVDDCSTDGSRAIAAAWLGAHEARFERVLLIGHDENQGLSQVRNTAFELARSDHVFVLDADNAIYPRAVARLLESLQDSGAGAAFSQLVLFGDTLQPGYADLWRPERFKPSNFVDAMALVSKAAWQRVGGYAHLNLGWEDYDFWCRFVENGIRGVYVPELLCRYRVHKASMLRTETDRNRARILQQLMFRHPWLELEI